MARQVSCYLSDQLKQALEREAIDFKSQGNENRDSINKNMIFIIEAFLDEYFDDMDAVSKKFVEILSKDFNEIVSKDISRVLDVIVKPYPLKYTDAFSNRFEEFRLKLQKHFNIKISKMNLYNFILLDYYIKNKVQIAKKELLFWMQDYFGKSKSVLDFKDILQMFNEWAKEEMK